MDKNEKHREYQRAWREKNREKMREYQRRWREANPDKAAENTQRWREENREKYLEGSRAAYYRRDPKHVAAVRRNYKLKRAYGITAAEFDERFTSQGNCCAICKGTDPAHHNWVVDHHHATGKIRGILCSPCNIALRKDRDTIEHLHRALKYIEEFESTL
jgi:hypothetical protein